MTYFASGYDLAKEMSVPAVTLEKTFKVYSEQAKAQKDPFGKKFSQNADFRMDDYFNVAIMIPFLHYTMGGSRGRPRIARTRSRKQAHPRIVRRW